MKAHIMPFSDIPPKRDASFLNSDRKTSGVSPLRSLRLEKLSQASNGSMLNAARSASFTFSTLLLSSSGSSRYTVKAPPARRNGMTAATSTTLRSRHTSSNFRNQSLTHCDEEPSNSGMSLTSKARSPVESSMGPR
ncbi:hypothetical protein M514_26484 [Trichuris suis]|uniref:Uncharacterized protein n=1 Tax=Trichuris suis TaxID=68888 RepID=A0A085MVV5_9BILA|nr:hypothetical protein M514_26484 [Trichuris suis]